MAKEEKKEEKKIIVDEDWKAEAQKEKEILNIVFATLQKPKNFWDITLKKH